MLLIFKKSVSYNSFEFYIGQPLQSSFRRFFAGHYPMPGANIQAWPSFQES